VRVSAGILLGVGGSSRGSRMVAVFFYLSLSRTQEAQEVEASGFSVSPLEPEEEDSNISDIKVEKPG
jgi:hypothetical protein